MSDLTDLAITIESTLASYIEAVGTPDAKRYKAVLEQILFDDKGTFAPALRMADALVELRAAQLAYETAHGTPEQLRAASRLETAEAFADKALEGRAPCRQ